MDNATVVPGFHYCCRYGHRALVVYNEAQTLIKTIQRFPIKPKTPADCVLAIE